MKAIHSPWFFVLLAIVFFLPFLGGAHLFDWDEINFAEISREMLAMGEYQRIYINYLPFWEKPPLFMWMQALSMSLFGVGEFAARFPNAICGIFTLPLLFLIGKKIHSPRFGFLWAMVYFGSVLPFLYFKSGIIDPWFNFFIFLSIYFFIQAHWKKNGIATIPSTYSKWTYLFLGGIILGLAILTKGPAALLIAGLCFFVYWISVRFKFYINVPEFLLYLLGASVAALTWFGVETIQNGTWLVEEFITYQYRLFSTSDAGHKGFPGYHFVVLLIGCFPASIFAIRSFFHLPKGEKHIEDFKFWMKILFWVVLILFTIIQTKIVHYSSLCYFPLSFLAAWTIHQIIERKIEFNRWMKTGLIAIAALFIIITIALPILGNNIDLLKPLLAKDPFALANLDAEVTWPYWTLLPALFLIALLVFSFFHFRKKNYRSGFQCLFFGTSIFIMLVLVAFINRIEAYSQNAAIEFLKSKAGQEVYVHNWGYKSYAQLFYADKQADLMATSTFKGWPQMNDFQNNSDFDFPKIRADFETWLIHGEIDRDVFIITRINKIKKLEDFAQGNIQEIGRKNGFVFYQRKAP